jgi:hypothetical protein
MRAVALVFLSGCALYIDPHASPDGGVPAECNHPEYSVAVLTPSNEAYVTNPVTFHWRWDPNWQLIPDRYVNIADDSGYEYPEVGGTWSSNGPDETWTVDQPVGMHLHIVLGWACHAGQPDEVDIELARSYFTVIAPVDGGV